ncbi:MAG: hypothetical protein P8P98_07945, partial [Emcibacteraceae bacterium]|nr:hypothetical protein [Emcibacteraceae bacterium]
MKIIINTLVVLMLMGSNALSDEFRISNNNRIDGLRPDAPALAKPGDYNIGVRTLNLHHKNQIDVLNIKNDEPLPHYDRPLTIEVWYPADTQEKGSEYPDVFLRDGINKATLYGSAVRDAAPLNDGMAYPLIVISHGYPGNRMLLSHFGENLASKGYVVASIDHTDSMYQDASQFSSTLYNRPRDQKFVLNTMNEFNKSSGHFLENIVDINNAGLIGYSMGGYGAVITAGAGVTADIASNTDVSPSGILEAVMSGSEAHETLVEGTHFKAIIAIAPWGMTRGFWDDESLKNLRIPTLFMAGSQDATSGYEDGIKALYEKSVNAQRYLLTFENAEHNAAAPIPAPKESASFIYADSKRPLFGHYADPVWDTLRMNNIAQHFVTAWLGKYLGRDPAMAAYLDLTPYANNSV